MENTAMQSNGAFAFVKELAKDLNRGDIELPSFPDVVLRIRQALEDEHCSTDKLVQLISAEPVLAARLLSVANSPALRPSGDPVTDLNMAVMRLGRTMIRNSAMSFAMTQLQKANDHEAIKVHLEAIWKQCAHVAALCYVLCRKYTKLNADEAMFVGLMHAIGNMFVIVRAESFPKLFENEADIDAITAEWGPSIGSNIVASWGFAEHVSEAVSAYKDTEYRHESNVNYTDILIVAHLVYRFTTADDDTEFQLNDVPAASQLTITAADMMTVLAESEEKINSLRHALGS